MASVCKLGEYIEKLNRPNTDLQYGIDDVCGITNTKEIMMGTRANLIGRTFEKFTVLMPGEFIFNRRTSRNGERISLGYNNLGRTVILTEDYCHFRIRQDKENELDADYLYLFFLNPEFDRYARFNSWGSATEFFNWEDMCEVPINIPDITKQKKVVRQYEAIINRINILENISKSVELIVDITYKKFIEERETHIGKIKDLGEFVRGKNITAKQMVKGDIDVISAGLKPSGLHNKWNVEAPSITVSGSGVNAGYFSIHFENIWAADCSYNNNSEHPYFLYESLKSVKELIEALKDGHSAQPHVYPRDFNEFEINILNEEDLLDFDNTVKSIFDNIANNQRIIKSLDNLKNTFLRTVV